MENGFSFEAHLSLLLHQKQVPLLVSHQVLRRRGLGQIDVCGFSDKGIFAAECKEGQPFLSFQQRKRLMASCHFLLNLFNCPVELFLFHGFAKSFESAYSFKSKKIGELR